MKALVFAFCFVITAFFVIDFRKTITKGKDGYFAFIRAAFDAFVIIAFAIIEKGRW